MAEVGILAVKSFIDTFKSKVDAYEQIKKRVEPQLAYRFSAFNWISLNENGLSQQIAYFLNPSEGHGQGDRFLRAFLEYIDKRQENAKIKELIALDKLSASVKTEESTKDGRRLDITITFQDKFKIGIENKIWADDQRNQLADYAKHLNDSHGD